MKEQPSEYDWKALLREIRPASEEVRTRIAERWDTLAKPLHGLGLLEDLWAELGAAQHNLKPQINRAAAVVFCADNGIVDEGVTQTDCGVTAIVAQNIAQGKASICLMAKPCGIRTFAIDVGMKNDAADVYDVKIARGTRNFARTETMSTQQCSRAIRIGIECAKTLKERGYDAAIAGEMGIGNTTTAAAVICALCRMPADAVAGKGAGLSDCALVKKKALIDEAIARMELTNAPAERILRAVGGFDLAAMCGLYLGGAIYRLPILMDGVISCAAALVAARICPEAAGYMIASHSSGEKGARIVLNALRKTPIIEARMALGEGTGAAALVPLLKMAQSVYYGLPTFEQASIEEYRPL